MNSKLQDVDDRTEKWLPMSQAHEIYIGEVEWVKRLIPDGASSHTNPAPFDRRRRPICTSDSTGKE
jgi:hypothetical protein